MNNPELEPFEKLVRQVGLDNFILYSNHDGAVDQEVFQAFRNLSLDDLSIGDTVWLHQSPHIEYGDELTCGFRLVQINGFHIDKNLQVLKIIPKLPPDAPILVVGNVSEDLEDADRSIFDSLDYDRPVEGFDVHTVYLGHKLPIFKLENPSVVLRALNKKDAVARIWS